MNSDSEDDNFYRCGAWVQINQVVGCVSASCEDCVNGTLISPDITINLPPGPNEPNGPWFIVFRHSGRSSIVFKRSGDWKIFVDGESYYSLSDVGLHVEKIMRGQDDRFKY